MSVNAWRLVVFASTLIFLVISGFAIFLAEITYAIGGATFKVFFTSYLYIMSIPIFIYGFIFGKYNTAKALPFINIKMVSIIIALILLPFVFFVIRETLQAHAYWQDRYDFELATCIRLSSGQANCSEEMKGVFLRIYESKGTLERVLYAFQNRFD